MARPGELVDAKFKMTPLFPFPIPFPAVDFALRPLCYFDDRLELDFWHGDEASYRETTRHNDTWNANADSFTFAYPLHSVSLSVKRSCFFGSAYWHCFLHLSRKTETEKRGVKVDRNAAQAAAPSMTFQAKPLTITRNVTPGTLISVVAFLIVVGALLFAAAICWCVCFVGCLCFSCVGLLVSS